MSYGPFQFGEIVEFDAQDHGPDPRDDVFAWTCEAKISGKAKAKVGESIFLIDGDGNKHHAQLEQLRRVNPRVGDIVRVRDGVPHLDHIKPHGDLVVSDSEPGGRYIVEAESHVGGWTVMPTEIYLTKRAPLEFAPTDPAMKDESLRYDNGEVIMVGDLISSESGVPGRIVDVIAGCKKTVGTSFEPGQTYHRLIAGLQFVQRGTLTDTTALREAYAEAEDDVLRGRADPSVLRGFSGLDPVTKDTNPKDALAGFKPRWFSFIPLRVLIGVGKAMFEGGWKYGKHNYRESGVRASVYLDATVCGHLMPFMEGQDFDENGMHHLDKAIASLMVLRDAQLGSNWIDDRPLAAKGFDEQVERETAHFQTMKAELKAKFGDPVAPYTEATRGQPR